MKHTTSVTCNEFIQLFEDYERESKFSVEGRAALYEWLEESESDTGEEYEVDIIGLCCEFTEYEHIGEAWRTYNDGPTPHPDTCLRWLEEHTIVIHGYWGQSVIIQDF